MTADRDSDDDGPSFRDGNAGRTGVFVARTEAERDDAFAVRRRVFVDEQGVDESLEWDAHDDPGASTTHFVAYDGGDVVGAARVRPATNAGEATAASDEPRTAKIERVAVAADRRGEGWGRRIMNAVEEWAREAGYARFALNAQTHVREFYERLGYEAHGEEFEEAGIPHVAMEKPLRGDDS